MKNKKMVISIVIAVAIIVGLFAYNLARPQKQFVSIAGNPVGQVGYIMAAGIADVVTKSNPNITVTAEETKGFLENMRLVIEGGAEAGMTNNGVLYEGYNAKGDYAAYQPKKVLGVMSISAQVFNIVAKEDSPINSLNDLKGKRVGIGQPGGTAMVDSQRLLEILNFKETDMTQYKVNIVEQMNMMRDNQLDASLWLGNIPVPSLVEYMATKKLKFIPIPDDVAAKVIEKYPSYVKMDLPANTYTSQTSPVKSYGVTTVFCVKADLPEKTVYEMTKAMMTNLDQLKKVHPGFGFISKDTVLTGLKSPIHPGAAKYFKEIGVPEIDEFLKKYPNN